MSEKSKAEKVVVITAFHSFVSKNILNTEVISFVKDNEEIKVVLIVPERKKDFFVSEFANGRVIVEGVNGQSIFDKHTEYFFNSLACLLIDTHYLHYKRKEVFELDNSLLHWPKYLLRELFVQMFAGRSFSRKFFCKLDEKFRKKSSVTKLFEKYKPDLVFSTDLFDQTDAQIIYEAKKQKIKTVGMVRSWDNCESKGLLRSETDHLITNNAVLKQELIDIHDVSGDNISVVGLPQFDSFVNEEPEDKEAFFQSFGFDAKKPLVLFASAGNVLSDTDPDICDILIKARSEGGLSKNTQFFVRNHPHHPASLDMYKDVEGMIIQTPGEKFEGRSDKDTELTRNDLIFLRNILAHTDVLVWTATSLCLDALVYDVPQVVLNFDGYADKDYYHSVKRYHDEGHMKRMFVHNPFRVANNATELIDYISMYLKDRSIDAKEREIVRQQQLYRLDGKSGLRISNIIKSLLTKDSVA